MPGQGVVEKPPGIPVEVCIWWASSDCAHTCDVCNGVKLLLIPEKEDDNEK